MILNMSSATGSHTGSPGAPGAPDTPETAGAAANRADASGRDGPSDADRTGRARIRDAAITRFAAGGVAGTSVRAIATDAGVSPALVIHHFGSKDGLRVACDQHVAALVRERKRAAIGSGAALDPLAALREAGEGPPLLRYLATTLGDGSPHVAELLDEMIEDAADYMEEGVRNGLLTPTTDPRRRAAVLTLWSLGALALHDHVQRVLGVDLTGDPADATAYFLPATEILGRGVITPEFYERIRAGLEHAQEERS
jgi:AcrR family transcriptional regulator